MKWVLFLIIPIYGFTQFSGQLLTEFQMGNLPVDKLDFFPSLYHRSSLDYSFQKLKIGITTEHYSAPFSSRNYFNIQQFKFDYTGKKIDLKLGNFYETLGRGLLLRSFEIPGAIIEDLSFRSRQYFHRDLLGGRLRWRINQNWNIKALYGAPLSSTIPPTFSPDQRYPERLGALTTSYNFGKHALEAGGMITQDQSYFMANLQGSLLSSLQYYAEFAGDGKDSYAIYGNLNLNFERIGISAEYKNYQNFALGTGFNEPPALVREQSYRVLNRMTHVPQPQNEKGYQIEMLVYFNNESTLTLNHSLAINEPAKRFIFQEYFAEYSFQFKEKTNLKFFVDYAKDPFKLQFYRWSGGGSLSQKLNKKLGLQLDYEYQIFKSELQTGYNQVYQLNFFNGSQFSSYLIAEVSNDQLLINKPLKTWLGAGGKVKINNNHSLSLFLGERRGGPACTSGVCYEIFDFRGLETRWAMRY